MDTRTCIQRNLSVAVRMMRVVAPAPDIIRNKNGNDQCHRIQTGFTAFSFIAAFDSLKIPYSRNLLQVF